MGEKRRGRWGGDFWDQRIGGNTPSVYPAHSGPVSLLGSWTWSSALQGQRHSWAPPAEMSLSSTHTSPRSFSSLVGPKQRPCQPPKPRPCLSPTPHREGLFWLFFPPVFYYCGSVLPSSCCFIYILIFFLSNISVTFLILFYFLLFVILLLLFSFFFLPFFLFFSFFFFFLLPCRACKILVHELGVGSEPLWWELQSEPLD